MIHLYSLTKFQSAFGIKKEIATEQSLEKLLKQTRYFTALAISGNILEKLLSNLYNKQLQDKAKHEATQMCQDQIVSKQNSLVKLNKDKCKSSIRCAGKE